MWVGRVVADRAGSRSTLEGKALGRRAPADVDMSIGEGVLLKKEESTLEEE